MVLFSGLEGLAGGPYDPCPSMFRYPKTYDVLVIGAGHAGVEAALAAARWEFLISAMRWRLRMRM